MNLELINNFIDQVQHLKVLVVGETIIDEFIDVSYEGQSMKSICPVFKLEGGKVIQQGGAQAIANHLYDFVKSVDVITNTSNEIVKTRYIDINDKKKHVEINKFETEKFKEINVNTSEYDVVIVADFGHGFLGDAIVWLAGLHAVAAIYHHVILKDGVLASMLPPR
jgi:bifunctional ADP-heptose synthase (sugar kinase/adenylyltransferase)